MRTTALRKRREGGRLVDAAQAVALAARSKCSDPVKARGFRAARRCRPVCSLTGVRAPERALPRMASRKTMPSRQAPRSHQARESCTVHRLHASHGIVAVRAWGVGRKDRPGCSASPFRFSQCASFGGPVANPMAKNRAMCLRCLSGTRDSNPRHPAWEAGTLPTELVPQSDRDVTKTRSPCQSRQRQTVACRDGKKTARDYLGERQDPGRPAAGATPASRGTGGELVGSPTALALMLWGRDVSLGKDPTASLRRCDYDRARLATRVVTSALPGESRIVYACCVSSSGQAGTRRPSEYSRCLCRVFPLWSRSTRSVSGPKVTPRLRGCSLARPSRVSCPSAAHALQDNTQRRDAKLSAKAQAKSCRTR